jgi:hypothetical protein
MKEGKVIRKSFSIRWKSPFFQGFEPVRNPGICRAELATLTDPLNICVEGGGDCEV